MGQLIQKNCCCKNVEDTTNNMLTQLEQEYMENQKNKYTVNILNNEQILENKINFDFQNQLKGNPSIKNSQIQNYDRLKQLQDRINFAPTLDLEVISSPVLQIGLILKINCIGLENSNRNGMDGCIYFGVTDIKDSTEYSENRQYFEEEMINDFIIPTSDQDKKHGGRHFQIYYCLYTNQYFIKDLGIGFGVFYKISQPVLLKDSYLINFGLIFCVVNFFQGDESRISQENLSMSLTGMPCKIMIKFYGGVAQGQQFVYEPINNQIIQIGRNKNNSISFNDTLLSKFQCFIQYKENQGWVLEDGYFRGGASTNGTWMYIAEDLAIQNEMNFKSNQTIFQVSLY